MLTERFPVNLIVLPDWSNYDKLFNENLMKMNSVAPAAAAKAAEKAVAVSADDFDDED